jgi:UDP-N-acetylglucosamine 2-epimerase (non-hydrolysing)
MLSTQSRSEASSLPVYFVIGTRAQFIKVAPVMRAMLDEGMSYTLIYTAQHRENIHEILDVYKLPQPDIVMYDAWEANTRSSFILWFVNILYKVLFQSRRYVPKPGILLTHGDTFTAWLAALMGKRAGCTVGHIESGCRSFNIFSPFPEEISRLITFRFSDIYFCADEWTVNNLQKYEGAKINMGANTMLDGVRYALNGPSDNQFDFEDKPFALVSIHRFENIFTSRFTDTILPTLINISKSYFLVFVMHPATRERIRSFGLEKELTSYSNIILHERFGFVEWIRLCNKAEFVITDGGSNQEELSYMGTPTLLLRNETERREGIGNNVVISKFDDNIIKDFVQSPAQYRTQAVQVDAYPSQKIVGTIQELSKV